MNKSFDNLTNQPVGLNDEPLLGLDKQDDLLQIDDYYVGLTSFISKCETPMTIAIQGSWGSGKTSTINYVTNYLRYSPPGRQVKSIVFNTWQYSQFDLGEDLIYALMEQLGTLISLDDNSGSQKFKKKVRNLIGPLVRNAVNVATSLVGIPAIGDGVANFCEEYASNEQQVANLASQLEELRDDFQEGVEAYCDATGTDRLAIFIDDLDRLDPSKAVQLMECLKIFLDSPRCVFVLAIDFEVVAQGVGTRYSAFSQHNDRSKMIELARSFFDKIIQVPFSMPTRDYKVDNFVQASLSRLGLQFCASEIQELVSAIGVSIGPNPRSIKRLVNSFELLGAISSMKSKSASGQDSRRALITLMLLCAQAAFPGMHRDISDAVTRGYETQVSDFFLEIRNVTDSDNGNAEHEIFSWKKLGFEYIRMSEWVDSITPTDESRIAEFLSALSRALIPSTDSDEFDVELLRDAMLLSGLTSRESSEPSGRPLRDSLAAGFLDAELARLTALRSDIRVSRKRDSVELFMERHVTAEGPVEFDDVEVSIADFYYDFSKVKSYFGPHQKFTKWKRFVENDDQWTEFANDALDEYSSRGFRMEKRPHGRAIAAREIRTKEEVDVILHLVLTAGEVMVGAQ